MTFLQFPLLHPSLFWTMAFILSIAFGFRGILIQQHRVANENRLLKAQNLVEWTPKQIIFVHYFQDFVYNLVGSLAGWAALYLLTYRLFLDAGPVVPPPPAGFVLEYPNVRGMGWSELALAVVALLGITAKLPQTIEGFILSFARAVETVTSKVAGTTPDEKGRDA